VIVQLVYLNATTVRQHQVTRDQKGTQFVKRVAYAHVIQFGSLYHGMALSDIGQASCITALPCWALVLFVTPDIWPIQIRQLGFTSNLTRLQFPVTVQRGHASEELKFSTAIRHVNRDCNFFPSPHLNEQHESTTMHS
jgi:hypothetical protein